VNCADGDPLAMADVVTPPRSPLFGTFTEGPVHVVASVTSGITTTAGSRPLLDAGDGPHAATELADAFGTLLFNAGWTGTATWHGAFVADATGGRLLEVAAIRFEGTIAGCGSGSLVLVTVDRGVGSPSLSRFWEVVPGLGTGNLAGATGVGRGVVDSAAGTSTLDGFMSCG
jgi:hypothetical protein